MADTESGEQSPQPPFVFVAGNIASGKSTLANQLHAALGGRLINEDVTGNPFLARFYSDMRRWSFHVDLRFLAGRAQALSAVHPAASMVVVDRCYLEGGVFAGLALAQGLVDAEEHDTYQMLFNILHAVLPKPAALIYLHASPHTLLARVQRRGRPFEQEMPLGYLEDLQRHYDTWAAGYRDAPVLRVDTDALDFRRRGAHLDRVVTELAPLLQRS